MLKKLNDISVVPIYQHVWEIPVGSVSIATIFNQPQTIIVFILNAIREFKFFQIVPGFKQGQTTEKPECISYVKTIHSLTKITCISILEKKVQFINLRKNPIFSDSTLIEIDAHETQILNTMMLIYHTTCLELTNSSP